MSNTIAGNGSTGPTTRGGLYAFDGGNAFVVNATISNNVGTAVNSLSGSLVDLRGLTAVTVPTTGVTAGALVVVGATLRLNDSASIVSATGDGIQASTLSSFRIENGNTVQGNGTGAVGVNCFNISPMTASAATLTRTNLANVTGAAGASSGCNAFP